MGDVSAYISTNVIPITDDQIFLSADLFNVGIRHRKIFLKNIENKNQWFHLGKGSKAISQLHFSNEYKFWYITT